jgi:hypothetical protein
MKSTWFLDEIAAKTAEKSLNSQHLHVLLAGQGTHRVQHLLGFGPSLWVATYGGG